MDSLYRQAEAEVKSAMMHMDIYMVIRIKMIPAMGPLSIRHGRGRVDPDLETEMDDMYLSHHQ